MATALLGTKALYGLKPGDVLWVSLDPEADEDLWDAAIETVHAAMPEGVTVLATIGIHDIQSMGAEELRKLRDQISEMLVDA